jgi:hypothetical protein
MSLQVTGKCRVYQFEDKTTYAKASLQVGKKKQDGEWENQWFNAKFVGRNKPTFMDKGQTIEITSGILDSFKGDKGTFQTIIIFDYEAGQAPVQSQQRAISDEVADNDDEDSLPF